MFATVSVLHLPIFMICFSVIISLALARFPLDGVRRMPPREYCALNFDACVLAFWPIIVGVSELNVINHHDVPPEVLAFNESN